MKLITYKEAKAAKQIKNHKGHPGAGIWGWQIGKDFHVLPDDSTALSSMAGWHNMDGPLKAKVLAEYEVILD